MAHEGLNRAPIWIRKLRIIDLSLSFSAACSIGKNAQLPNLA
jgi:hypothetical protein